MHGFRIFLGVIFGILSVLVSMVWMVILTIHLTAANPTFYKETLRRANFYHTAASAVASAVVESAPAELGDKDQLEQLLTQVLEKQSVQAALQTTVEQTIDSTNDYLRTNGATFTPVDLVAQKEALGKALSEEAAALPLCAPGTAGDATQLCLESEEARDQLQSNILTALLQSPDQIEIPADKINDFQERVSIVQHNFFRASILLWAGGAFAIGLLLLVPLLAGGFSRHYFSWFAALLMIPGLFWALVAGSFRTFVPSLTANFVKQLDLPGGSEAVSSLVAVVANSFAAVLFYIALVMIIAGAVAIVVNRVLNHSAQKSISGKTAPKPTRAPRRAPRSSRA